nr:MAG TPA: hypothetical protein [Caudoviricetes sp.]
MRDSSKVLIGTSIVPVSPAKILRILLLPPMLASLEVPIGAIIPPTSSIPPGLSLPSKRPSLLVSKAGKLY